MAKALVISISAYMASRFKTLILEEVTEMILLVQLDKVLERFYASVFKQVDGTNLSPMILKGNQMVFS